MKVTVLDQKGIHNKNVYKINILNRFKLKTKDQYKNFTVTFTLGYTSVPAFGNMSTMNFGS